MRFELFVARRIAASKYKTFSRLITRIAVVAVALSLGVMIVSNAVVTGFQHEIRAKVFNFLGHIQVTHFDSNISYEPVQLDSRQPFYAHLDTAPGFRHIQVFATKAGIIKTDEAVEGVVLKGVDTDYDWSFLETRMVTGQTFRVTDTATSNKIIISRMMADRLHFEVGDEMIIYFVQDPPRVRKLTISGIYNTGLEEYDKLYAFVDIRHIRKLNGWEPYEVGGFEVFIDDMDLLDERTEYVFGLVPHSMYAQSLKEVNPNIFGWLEMQTLNERVILILMMLVAGINMITVLLVLILERTNMIGVLKALGAPTGKIQTIFLLNAIHIVSFGLLWGNVAGLGLLALQHFTGFITLPEQSYYVSEVPVMFNWGTFLLYNLGTVVVCTLMLLFPSYLVARISPIRAIRFE